MNEVRTFRDLRVCQKLLQLHLDVHEHSMSFPKFELYELGSQVRRSSNAAAAILAEGWGSRHTNMYIEAISRAMGEARETQHHLSVARAKGYLAQTRWAELEEGYDHCGRMLERLHQALSAWSGTTRTGLVVKEAANVYAAKPLPERESAWAVSLDLDAEMFPLTPDTQHPTPVLA